VLYRDLKPENLLIDEQVRLYKIEREGDGGAGRA
jgi:serine/threonine protein kinase